MTKQHLTIRMQQIQTPALLALCLSLLPPAALALTENYIPKGIDYIFYTSLMAGILFAALIITAYREYKWLFYAGFAALLTLDLAAMDGNLAYLLGNSDYVLWLVPFLIHSIATSYGYALIAGHLDSTHRLVQFKPIFIALAVLSALFPLTSFFWLGQIPLPTMWLPVNILFFLMILGQMLPPLTWQASTQFETTLTQYMAVIIVGVTLLLYGSYYLSDQSTLDELTGINRIALLVFSFGSLSIVVLRLFIHNKEKEQAKQAALLAAKKQAETELTLLKLEHNYQDALTIASQHQSQLSSVSHDLKQPIAVLRMVLNQLKRTDNNIDTQRLDHTISYMDDLIQQLLMSEDLNEAGNDVDVSPSTHSQETISTALLAQTLK